MELKILNDICEKITNQFQNELSDIGGKVRSMLEKELKELNIEYSQSINDFAFESIKSELILNFTMGFAFKNE